MVDQILVLPGVTPKPTLVDQSISQLRQEYTDIHNLFLVQPSQIQRYLETQAATIAGMVVQGSSGVRFNLPDQVLPLHGSDIMPVPAQAREQTAVSLADRLTRADLRTGLRNQLQKLAHSPHPAISTSALLLRHAIAIHMVHDMLPAGRSVTYTTADGDTIPSIPLLTEPQAKSAIADARDAIAERRQDQIDPDRLQVPYVEAARRFFLPQWVAFDNQYHLLVGSLDEARAYIASMQRYLFVLHAAVGLAPYMVADEQYQQKRYGILGQLVNQGRSLTRYQVQEIVSRIQHRAVEHDLNRGLSISLPYFDDQNLTVENYEFEVVPAGRIMFVPAFVVRACHDQQLKVAQDTRLSPSTRKHLLTELYLLGKAFYSPDGGHTLRNKG